MIDAGSFLDQLRERGFGPYLSVPCPVLDPLINCIIDTPQLEYVPANNEGEAVAISAGGYLAGKKPVILCQNSGLGNMVNPLTSLTYTFRIPLLLIVSHRGRPGLNDQPQHELMGRITETLLEVVNVVSAPFPQADDEVAPALDTAAEVMAETDLPYALVMPKGSVAKRELNADPAERKSPVPCIQAESDREPAGMLRNEAVAITADSVSPETAIIATTGKTARELFYHNDRAGNFYVIGSMGCASSIALGSAISHPARRFVVLDGDGAALMRLEAMVSIGHYRPANLIHVILDNGVHDSTGGQPTLSDTVQFELVASACGYASAARASTPETYAKALARCTETAGPHMVHVPVLRGSDPNLGRPTVTPVEVKRRFMEFLQDSSSH